MAYLVRRLLENTANESFLRPASPNTFPSTNCSGIPRGHGRMGNAYESTHTTPCASHPSHSQAFRPEPLTDFGRPTPAGRWRRRWNRSPGSSAAPTRSVIGGKPAGDAENHRLVQPIAPPADRRPMRRRHGGAGAAGRRSRGRRVPEVARHGTGEAAQYLFDAADVMRRRRFELAAWQVYECGKPWREADADVAETIDYCEFYGREMLRSGRAAAARRPRRGERLFLRTARRRRWSSPRGTSRWPSCAA